MRSTSRGGGSNAPVEQPITEPAAADDGGSSPWSVGWAQRWWTQSGAGVPLLMRVPRGIALLAAVGLVGLLVLAYWVGHTRGVTAGRQTAGETVGIPAQRGAPADPFNTRVPAVNDRQPVPSGASGKPAKPADPRVAGHNYLILARYPLEDARRLAEFLREQGVASVLVPVDNGSSFHVIAADEGFTSDEFGSERKLAYERKMQAIGRAWKRHNNNRGDALETMYFAKYNGN